MDKPLLSYTLWLSLTSEQKRKLVRLFSISRTGEVVVHVGEMMGGNIGGKAQQDGHRPEDLYAITNERMIELLNLDPEEGEQHNFYVLWQEVLDNLDSIYADEYPDETEAAPELTAVEQPPVTPVTLSEEEFVPRDPEELIKPREEEPPKGGGIDIPVGEPIEETAPKNKKDAKTTKAKSSKAK